MSTGKGNGREGTYTTKALEMEKVLVMVMGMGMESALE